MNKVDTYIKDAEEVINKKAILSELNKGAKNFNESAIPYLTELSQSGEYMQRAKLSLKIIEIEKTPEDIKATAVEKQQKIREEEQTRGGSLRKTKKTKKRYNL